MQGSVNFLTIFSLFIFNFYFVCGWLDGREFSFLNVIEKTENQGCQTRVYTRRIVKDNKKMTYKIL